MRLRRSICAISAVTCVTLAVVAPLATASAATGTRAAAGHETMLVFLAPGASSAASPRAARAANASAASLAVRLGADVLARTTVPDTLTIRATSWAAHELSLAPGVLHVLPDALIPAPADPVVRAAHPSAKRPTKPKAPAAACGTAAHPELDPEALTNIDDAGNDTMGFTGKGVKVAFLADGLQINDADFRRNQAFASGASPKGSAVIVQYKDFSGDGTSAPTGGGEAFLDSSSIAAQGNAVYNLDRYVSTAHPLPKGCDIRIVGAAPGSSVLALKIFGSDDDTTGSGFVQAINYAVAQGASVINESFGSNPFPDQAADIVKAADDAAVAAGVTVVASSGDAGISSTIGSPATDPNVIGVGATTTYRAYQQYNFGGINLPGEKDTYLDNNISGLSSGGFGQDGKTVDLVAPGDLNWTLCSPSPDYQDCAGLNFQLSGGTSESSPLTSGAAADVIEAYRTSHHGTTPSPAMVKQILTSSATDIGAPSDQQGAGLLNVGAAVRLALSMPGSARTQRPGGLLASTGQLDVSGAPGSVSHQSITVTNTSSSTVHVKASTRTLVPYRIAKGHVTLNPGLHTKQPKLNIWSGALEVYQTVKFRALPGDARLQLQAGYRYTNQSSLLHVALFSPSGQLADFSNPQGLGDYADVEVADPAPGVWTAAFFTVWNGYGSGNVGTSGPVPYAFTESKYHASGSLSASTFALAPDASTTLTYNATFASTAGDTASAIVLSSLQVPAVAHEAAIVTTIPVIERAMIQISASGGGFHGVLTGGNGRPDAPGQTDTYAFTIGAGEHDLDVGIKMASNPAGGLLPGTQLIGELVDPDGQTAAYDTNFTLTTGGEVETRYVDLYKANPIAGTWSIVLDWAQPGTGVLTSIPFTGSVEFNQVSVLGNLPDSTGTDISTAGASYSVMVHNTGVAPMIVSPDARLPTTTPMVLSDITGGSATQPLPGAADEFYIPTETTSIEFDEQATVPATFDAQFATGDPDLSPLYAEPYATESWSATDAQLTYAPPTGVSAGLWVCFQDEMGPYPVSGEPSASETTTTTATTLAFDPAVTSPVPDTVQNLNDGGSLDPDFVPAGGEVSIPITITPTEPVGTHVSGTLFINGFAPGSAFTETIAQTGLFTSDLAAIPYAYTVST